ARHARFPGGRDPPGTGRWHRATGRRPRHLRDAPADRAVGGAFASGRVIAHRRDGMAGGAPPSDGRIPATMTTDIRASSMLNAARRGRELDGVADGGEVDLLVIGGGVTGAG